MRKRLALVLAPALLLAMLPGSVSAGNPNAKAADAAAAREHARVLAYWTPERIRNAKPRDFVRGASGFQPAARPSKPGGGGSGVVTGASYPNNAARRRVPARRSRAVQPRGVGLHLLRDGREGHRREHLARAHRRPLRDGERRRRRPRRTGCSSRSSTARRRTPAAARPTAAGRARPSTATASSSMRAASTTRPSPTTGRSSRSVAGGKGNTQLDALGAFGLAAPGVSLGQTRSARTATRPRSGTRART